MTLRAPAAFSRESRQLHRLSRRLGDVLERGQVPVPGLPAETAAALRDPTDGVAADYRKWLTHLRQYYRLLRERNAYREPQVVEQLLDDPVTVPWRLEQWVRDVAAGLCARRSADAEEANAMSGRGGPLPRTRPAGGAAGAPLAQAEALLSELPGVAVKAPSVTAAALHTGVPALDRFVNRCVETSEIVDRQALGRVPRSERELASFVVPWITAVNGRYHPASKGAPDYSMHMIFYPSDPFSPGALVTTNAQVRVPPALFSMTGVYHYLRALAGAPVVTQGIPEDWEAAAPHPQFANAVDFAALGAALRHLGPALDGPALTSLERALQELPANVTSSVPGVSGLLVAEIPTPQGVVLVGGKRHNEYRDVEALAIVDLGGDDDYVWTNAQARLGRQPLAVIVDYAGDDVYRTEGVGGPAAGILGVSVLVDRRGRDRYLHGVAAHVAPRSLQRATLLEPDPEGSNTTLVVLHKLFGDAADPAAEGVPLAGGFAFGAGFLGVGVLLDEQGDDIYVGQKFLGGVGMWQGVGVLQDRGGDDVYVAGLASWGVGVNGGFGVLEDGAGNDHYQCLGMHESGYSAGEKWDNGFESGGIGFGSSWRGEARREGSRHRWPATFSGGVGLVHDGGGDDEYVGSSFGVAASYAGGIGIVVDDEGNDTYFVKRGPKGANQSGFSGNHALANGCHRGIGYLLDRAGNDRYSASNLGGGTGWDLGMGYLLDLGGDDVMTDLHGCREFGNTGWAAAKAFAVSFHAGGRDVYERHTLGSAEVIGDGYPGEGGNFAFFVDEGAEPDWYPAGYTNDVRALGRVYWRKDEKGASIEGIGLFLDGADALK
jgi:hypothetical protein